MSYLGGSADITIRVQSILREPLQNRVAHLNNISEQIPFKELQTVFPEIVNSIFGNGGMSEDWGLRVLTERNNPYDFRLLHEFLSPISGGLFRMIYKLIGDPQIRYHLPMRVLPMDLYELLQSKRIPKFYLDTLVFEPQNRHIIGLSLNPFDFYIFHFAIHLCNSSYAKSGRDNWNTPYYTLACDYLIHFLPRDPNCPVLPYIPYFTGKTPVVSPLQTVNNFRQCQFPSLFTCQEIGANAGIASTSTQLHPRGEMWRSETVLQAFIDVWLNRTIQTAPLNESSPSVINTYPASEHVRITRLLVKQCHSFAMSASSDVTSVGELRRITTAMLSPRAYLHIQHLMQTWPLDSSFRQVLELWFSFIQPWRYANIKDDKFGVDSTPEETHKTLIDRTFLPFISENLSAYTEIFHLVMPRFLRLDLTAPKNAIMLFRLTKVFSQTNLLQLLKEAESSVTLESDVNDLTSGISFPNSNATNDSVNYKNSFMSAPDQSMPEAQLNFQGRKLQLLSSRQYACELMVMAQHAFKIVQENIRNKDTQLLKRQKGFFSDFINFLFGDGENYDDIPLEEMKKVPLYLNSSIQQLAEIFSLSISERCENPETIQQANISGDNSIRQNPLLSPRQARERMNHIKYMGDPDLEPIKTFENGAIVKLSRYISTKINDVYAQEIKRLYERQDCIGTISKEIVQKPMVIRHFVKDQHNNRMMLTESLPPRISLRSLASHKLIFWISFFCCLCYLLGYNVLLSNIVLFFLWFIWTAIKGCCKHFFGSSTSRPPENLNLLNDYNLLDSSN